MKNSSAKNLLGQSLTKQGGIGNGRKHKQIKSLTIRRKKYGVQTCISVKAKATFGCTGLNAKAADGIVAAADQIRRPGESDTNFQKESIHGAEGKIIREP
ncbi:hypothetical protein MTP99_009760 [Tenebrio molitor]|jgi:hypothetical protein|nr:hypothetical protein MTP99_009760 [Tenebrio molitor]